MVGFTKTTFNLEGIYTPNGAQKVTNTFIPCFQNFLKPSDQGNIKFCYCICNINIAMFECDFLRAQSILCFRVDLVKMLCFILFKYWSFASCFGSPKWYLPLRKQYNCSLFLLCWTTAEALLSQGLLLA